MNHNTNQFRPEGNYELQQLRLTELHQEISNRLFMLGVASRIVKARPPELGAKTDVNGVEQLDKLFVPALASKKVDGRNERVLRLAIITPQEKYNGKTYGYTNLGEIDEQGFLHVYSNIPEDDAWTVFNEASALETLRLPAKHMPAELPQLDSSLLFVHNPNTAIRKS